ncbi:transporter [Ganoderma sinense ZZ0214-1]|uniref:laccase n=1 Tax=Ganoderma sinense ZZ0214-1 TaxID=1077348 RepID=A0A2G8RQE7_9APHY|nr:transporter [Ganoderma sinense ZZ0214-1]
MAVCKLLSSAVFVALKLALNAHAHAIGPVADLTITNADLAPDGFTRAAVAVNGMSPGPLITGQKGDRFQINVINRLTNHTMLKSTSIHWHGLYQRSSNWADGVAFVNQCPIASDNSFLYDFEARNQAGTFWYHSHLSVQYCDGLRGPLVIYDPEDPHEHRYDVDDDNTVITLADWYHVTYKLGPKPLLGADATLINGKGRSTSTLNASLSVISVTHGRRYRFRLISISCDANFVFSIDDHPMTIIEADAVNTRPHAVDSIQIFAGQRYSFVFHANQTVDNYWIRAKPNAGHRSFERGMNSAILRYKGAPEREPTPSDPPVSVKPLVEAALRTLVPTPAPGSPDSEDVDVVNLNITFSRPKFLLNGQAFVSPPVPVLLQIMSGAQDAKDLLPARSLVVLPSNSTVQISFPIPAGLPGGPHPLHMHGHKFAVVRSANSSVYNYKDPIWRDVVGTGQAGDNVTIRFKTDNPGPWFLHCHIDPHLEQGLAIVMVEGTPSEIEAVQPEREAWDKLCPTYNALRVSDQ